MYAHRGKILLSKVDGNYISLSISIKAIYTTAIEVQRRIGIKNC